WPLPGDFPSRSDDYADITLRGSWNAPIVNLGLCGLCRRASLSMAASYLWFRSGCSDRCIDVSIFRLEESTMPIYMEYDGGSIAGDATAEGHEKWIELNSLQWGVGRGISSPTGGSADRESSAPSVSEIVVTKPTDIASVKLLNEALQGEGKTV